MKYETSDVFRFDLWSPLQGQMSVAKLKGCKSLIIEICYLNIILLFLWIHLASGPRCIRDLMFLSRI